MLKKVFIISSLLFGVFLLLWLIFVFFLQKKEVETSPSIQDPSLDSSLTKDRTIRPVLDFSVISPTLSEDGEKLFAYHADTGALYEIDRFTGSREVLMDTNLTNPIIALWSKESTSSILRTAPQNGNQFFLVQHKDQSILPVQGGGVYLVWDALSEQIVYIKRKNPETITFYVSRPNGSSSKEIATIQERANITMSGVPQSPLVAVWPESANNRLSPLFTLNLSSGSRNEIFAGKYGADYLYAPNGKTILMSWAPKQNGSELALATINSFGAQYTDLKLPTLTSKCTWSDSSETLYCAVPTGIPQSAVMPDEYKAGKLNTKDVFWKINVKTGEKERLIELSEIDAPYDATKLMVTPDEQYLYFVDRTTNILYEMSL